MRVPPLREDDLSPEQRRLFDEIGGARGGTVAGPFAIWLRTPEIADSANRLGNAVRLHGRLDRRLFELMVLITARHWTAQYEWSVHEPAARKAGLAEPIIDALRHRRQPDFTAADERVVYDTITELYETGTLTQPTYDRALAEFGLETLIELISGAGFYTVAAMTINAFQYPPPGEARPLPD
jgi:4-carboxymuconolactone decarboxylase